MTPGAALAARCTTADFPPMVTSGVPPSPAPVANSVRAVPAIAGCEGELGDPSTLIARTCPAPVESAVKRPGAEALNGSGNGCVETFAACTTICTVGPATPLGTIAEIW